jgi:hypothetical protein
MHVVDPALDANDPAACTSPGRRLQPNYLKIGMYRAPRTSVTQAVYHDGMRVGTSYAAVTPTGEAKVTFPRRCTSRRMIRIRVSARETHLRLLRATINNKPVRVRSIDGLSRARIDLRGRPRARNVVRLKLLTSDGRRYSGKHSYSRCG